MKIHLLLVLFCYFWVNLFLAVWKYQGNINVSDKVNPICCGQESKEIGTTKKM